MEEFNREISVYRDYFWDFYNKQTLIVQKKIDWTIGLVKILEVVPKKFLTHITNSDGIWEIRVKAGNGIFRIFCFFDNDNLVVVLSGFQKKSQKTPRNEIKRAEKLKKEYYEEKE